MILKPQRAQSTQRKYPLWSLCALWLILFLSCATTATHNSIDNITPQWESLADGIEHFHGKLSSPNIEFWALKIDLSSPNINIVINDTAATVSDFVRNNNLIAGINAAPFDKNHKNLGLVIINGDTRSPVNRNYDALVFYKDNQTVRAVIVSQASIHSIQNIQNAVGGFHQILKDGIPTQRTLREGTVSAQRHPRSAAGVNADGSVLYLLCIDGRRPGSVGATEMETALLLRSFGSNDGLNFDGGGSSALVLRFPDGSVKPINKPSNFGGERKVAACLGISN